VKEKKEKIGVREFRQTDRVGNIFGYVHCAALFCRVILTCTNIMLHRSNFSAK